VYKAQGIMSIKAAYRRWKYRRAIRQVILALKCLNNSASPDMNTELCELICVVSNLASRLGHSRDKVKAKLETCIFPPREDGCTPVGDGNHYKCGMSSDRIAGAWTSCRCPAHREEKDA